MSCLTSSQPLERPLTDPSLIDEPTLPLLVEAAARGASNLLADNIVVLMVGDVLAITDHFVIASASNTRQVKRIVEEVESEVKSAGGEGPLRIEGLQHGRWALMDFGPFVVHVFHDETRRFYDLERLWSDVPRHDWVDESARVD